MSTILLRCEQMSTLVAYPAEMSEEENYSWPQLAFAINLDKTKEGKICFDLQPLKNDFKCKAG